MKPLKKKCANTTGAGTSPLSEPENSTAPEAHSTTLHSPAPLSLLELAKKEHSHDVPQDVPAAITELRDAKHWSFRKIAAWLNRHGLEYDANKVYRLYQSQIQKPLL